MVSEARGAADVDGTVVVVAVVEASCWRRFCRFLDVPVLSVRWYVVVMRVYSQLVREGEEGEDEDLDLRC